MRLDGAGGPLATRPPQRHAHRRVRGDLCDFFDAGLFPLFGRPRRRRPDGWHRRCRRNRRPASGYGSVRGGHRRTGRRTRRRDGWHGRHREHGVAPARAAAAARARVVPAPAVAPQPGAAAAPPARAARRAQAAGPGARRPAPRAASTTSTMTATATSTAWTAIAARPPCACRWICRGRSAW